MTHIRILAGASPTLSELHKFIGMILKKNWTCDLVLPPGAEEMLGFGAISYLHALSGHAVRTQFRSLHAPREPLPKADLTIAIPATPKLIIDAARGISDTLASATLDYKLTELQAGENPKVIVVPSEQPSNNPLLEGCLKEMKRLGVAIVNNSGNNLPLQSAIEAIEKAIEKKLTGPDLSLAAKPHSYPEAEQQSMRFFTRSSQPQARHVDLLCCAAPPVENIGELVQQISQRGWTCNLIFSEHAMRMIDNPARLYNLHAKYGCAIHVNSKPPPRTSGSRNSSQTLTMMVPATLNTIAKVINGITDTAPAAMLHERISAQPENVIVMPFTHQEHGRSLRYSEHLYTLRRLGVTVVAHGVMGYQFPQGTTIGKAAKDFPWEIAMNAIEQSFALAATETGRTDCTSIASRVGTDVPIVTATETGRTDRTSIAPQVEHRCANSGSPQQPRNVPSSHTLGLGLQPSIAV